MSCGCSAKLCTMEVLSMIKHSLVADGSNPITKYFQIGKHVASAGPELVWKIFDAVRIEDKQEASVFIFEKRVADKLHKPRRRETVAEILRKEVKHLEKYKHPKILQLMHPLEECHDSLAFATEPVLGSLANFLGNSERMPNPLPPEIKDNEFLEVEVKYGILQITEALTYLHGGEQLLHSNINPQSIIITRKGAWKLSGLGFAEKTADGKDSFQCTPWTNKSPKMAQPDLDYIAPELQLEKNCTFLCDMFSLGLVICAIYNGGKSLLDSNKNTTQYAKKVEQLHESFGEVAHKLPLALVEPVEKMINRDIRYRPTAQLFSLLKYFSDPVVKCLQYLDVIEQSDMADRLEFYSGLPGIIPTIPKKVQYQHVFPVLKEQMRAPDMLAHVFPSILAMIQNATMEEYKTKMFPGVQRVFLMPKPVQATVVLLDNLDIILAKTPKEDVKTEVMPLVFNMLDSNSAQGQEAALNTIAAIQEYLDEYVMKKMVLPKAKSLFNKSSNIKMKINALLCIDKLLDKLDKMIILDEVLPFLTDITTYQDTEILMAVIGIYKHMLSDRKFGLTHNLIASKVMPPLIPCTVSPGLNMEQFGTLMEVLREMLEQIDRQRRNKMKMERMNSEGSITSRPTIKMHLSVEKPDLSQQTLDRQSNKNYLCVDDAVPIQKVRTVLHEDSNLDSPETPELLKSLLNIRTANANMSNSVIRYNPKRRHSSAGLPIHLSALLGQYKEYKAPPPAPSTPEIQQRAMTGGVSSNPLPRRRHSSVHGLGTGPNNVQKAIVVQDRITDRRCSLLIPEGVRNTQQFNPNMLLPDSHPDAPLNRRLSTQSLGPVVVPDDKSLNIPANRRPSTQSVGAVIVPSVPPPSQSTPKRRGSSKWKAWSFDEALIERRESKFTLFDTISPTLQRRTSFSSLGESVMQLFTGKS
ncbi:SCY1-like protein 2 isoform X3 [Lineus longissimus]|uniref:SCY1-like protein 2 isoform X3 n=1 Tax=Lineus longissimus TaxID=88925 RepID=UPI00315CA71C